MFFKNTFDRFAAHCILVIGILVIGILCVRPKVVTGLEPPVYVAEVSTAIDNTSDLKSRSAYRGPVELVLAADESWAVTVNELSHSLTLIDLNSRQIVEEVPCPGRPAGCIQLADDELLVTCRDAGVVRRFAVHRGEANQLRIRAVATIEVGFEPLGLAVSYSTARSITKGPALLPVADLTDSRGKSAQDKIGIQNTTVGQESIGWAAHQRSARAYAGLVASGEVAEIDLENNVLLRRIRVGKWPRYLAVSPDGSKLAVGLSGESSVAVFNLPSGEPAYDEPLSGGINLGIMRCSQDGQYVYFPWMIYRSNPIDPGNIRRGWVLASRVARVRLDGPTTREAISLDVPRLAVADPHGLAITPDETRMAVTSAGTHELLVYRVADMPFIGAGGPGDLIDERLLRNREAFYRIPLDGRPLGVEPSYDNHTVYVANHTLDSLQIVDLDNRQIAASISLGAPATDPQSQVVHRGMEIFHDAGRSLDQWYSCRSCHLDGGSNAKAMDTWNDGSDLTAKTVLPLAGVTETGPWTWHGWQQDLDESIQNSFVSTMQGQAATAADVQAVRAYLAALTLPQNPFLAASGAPDSHAARQVALGKELFHSAEVGCTNCHSGSRFTDGQVHDVGLGNESDKYQGFNTPSLVGVYAKVRLLHDGRSKSLEDVLTNWHSPSEIGGGAELEAEQLAQLVAYLKTL